MASSAPSREALENLWRERLQESQRRYLIAKTACANAGQLSADVPMADGHLAFQRALQIEAAALKEYKHALTVFTDLTVHGKAPPE